MFASYPCSLARSKIKELAPRFKRTWNIAVSVKVWLTSAGFNHQLRTKRESLLPLGVPLSSAGVYTYLTHHQSTGSWFTKGITVQLCFFRSLLFTYLKKNVLPIPPNGSCLHPVVLPYLLLERQQSNLSTIYFFLNKQINLA